MATAIGERVIALEEHYADPEVMAHFGAGDSQRSPQIVERLLDVGEQRLKEMDAHGIDVQVLSHASPSTQKLDPAIATKVAREANDRLAETVRAHPDRFAGFACLPTPNPQAAADELERTVTELGFRGAMVHGMTNGVFLDDKRFWPIFERAQTLDVPLYLHPTIPHPDVVDVYYRDYLDEHPALQRAAWGFAVETATHAIRIVLSGVFDRYPGAKMILGHLGEALPFSLWRINSALSRGRDAPSRFRDTFCEHFWITTSGNFSNPALLCCIQEMGVDRILFSVDYPFESNPLAMEWVERVPLSGEDRRKILHGNTENLLRL